MIIVFWISVIATAVAAILAFAMKRLALQYTLAVIFLMIAMVIFYNMHSHFLAVLCWMGAVSVFFSFRREPRYAK